jgi:hypothetical protein
MQSFEDRLSSGNRPFLGFGRATLSTTSEDVDEIKQWVKKVRSTLTSPTPGRVI